VADRVTIERVAGYMESIYRLVDPHEVLSAVHDAWLRLNSKGKPTTFGWLFTESRKILWVRRRSLMRLPRTGIEIENHYSPVATEYRERPEMRSLIDGLPRRQQEDVRGIILRQTASEQAREFGSTAGAIKVRRKKLVRKLRTILSPNGDVLMPIRRAGRPVSAAGMVFYQGRMMTMRAVAEEAGVNYRNLARQIRVKGKTAQEAVDIVRQRQSRG